MKRLWIVIVVLLLILGGSALAERTVYADQGGAAVFMEHGKICLF